MREAREKRVAKEGSVLSRSTGKGGKAFALGGSPFILPFINDTMRDRALVDDRAFRHSSPFSFLLSASLPHLLGGLLGGRAPLRIRGDGGAGQCEDAGREGGGAEGHDLSRFFLTTIVSRAFC